MIELESAERMQRFYNREEIDRVPVFSCATMYSGWHKGLSSSEFYFDVKKAYHAQREILDEKSFDDLPCYDLPHGELLDFGGELSIKKDGKVALPLVQKFGIETIEDAWSFELPPMEQRRFTKLIIEFLRYARKQGQTGVTISAGSLFTMVGSMVDTNLLMRWLSKEPDVVNHLLKIAIRYLCETADILIEEFGINQCSASSNYPFESNGIISPRIFKQFAYPAMMEIHERFREKGLSRFGIHLCGHHGKNMHFFKDLNLLPGSFISSDEANSLKEVAEVFGKDCIYRGNVSTRLLVSGTQKQVYQQSCEIIRDMKYNDGGFVLMPSCDLPINTRPENLDAMLQAAYDFGSYDNGYRR